MKFSVHVEFTEEELLKHAQDLGRRIVYDGFNDVIRTIVRNPSLASAFGSVFSESMRAGYRSQDPFNYESSPSGTAETAPPGAENPPDQAESATNSVSS